MAWHRSDVAHCSAGRGSEGLGRGGVSLSFTTETTKSFRLMHSRCCSCSFFLQDRFYGVHPHSSTKIPGFSIPLQGLEHNHGAILGGGTGGVWKCLHGSRVLKVFK